jgi:hypothetical protein
MCWERDGHPDSYKPPGKAWNWLDWNMEKLTHYTPLAADPHWQVQSLAVISTGKSYRHAFMQPL